MSSAKNNNLIKWAVIFILPLCMLLIPTTDVFTMQHKSFLCITLWTILMFAFGLVDNYIPAIIMPMLFIATGVADWETAYAGLHNPIVWQVLGIFLLVNALMRNGFLKRLAYACILRTSCSYNGLLLGMYLFGLVFNLFLPGGSCVAMATFAFSICAALGLKQSNTAAGITLAGAMGYLQPGLFIYVPSNFGLMASIAKEVDPSLEFNFATYLMHNAIFILFGFFMVFVISKMFKPEQPLDSKEFFKSEQAKLGKMDREEKISAVAVVLLVAYIFANSVTGWSLAYIFVLLPAVLAFPIFNVVKKEDIDKIDFKFIFFLASCMSIGFVAASIGITDIIAAAILPLMQNVGTYGLIAITWALGVSVNFLLTPLAAMASFGAPITSIAMGLGIDPYALIYTFNNGLDQVLFPYEYAIYLLYFSFGMIKMKDFMKFFGVKMICSFAFIMILAIPYWKLVGIL